MPKSNAQTTETTSTETVVQTFDVTKFLADNGNNKSKTIKHMATLPEFQKDNKVNMGAIVKCFVNAGIKASTGGDMRYQFVRNVLTAKPKKG